MSAQLTTAITATPPGQYLSGRYGLARELALRTKESFWEAFRLIEKRIEAGDTLRLGDIGHTIESYVNRYGFSVVRKYVGHGIGRNIHESPDVPNYGKPGRGQRVTVGMAIAVEPMVTSVLAKSKNSATADGGNSGRLCSAHTTKTPSLSPTRA